MLVNSFKSLSDLLNDSVKWIPTSFCLDNYTEALKVMKFSKTIVQTLELSFIPALCQVVVAALTGYAFARYRFPGRKLLLALLVLTFVLPKQATMLPTYLMFKDMDLIGTPVSYTHLGTRNTGMCCSRCWTGSWRCPGCRAIT